jgi:hypothetical protein
MSILYKEELPQVFRGRGGGEGADDLGAIESGGDL